MIYRQIALAITTALAIGACSQSGNPQLDMCKKITGNLLMGSAEYGEITESKGRESMQLTLPYTSDGVSSQAVCTFAKDPNQEGAYQTSPKTMTLDGVQIGTKELMKASFASSKEVMKDTAEETKKQTAEAAEEAKVMAAEAAEEAKVMAAEAKEMATDAKDKAAELAGEAKVKAGEVATKIQESEVVDRAKVLAEDAKGKAKAALLEGTKKLQESLEN